LRLPFRWSSNNIDKWQINNWINESGSAGEYQPQIKLFRQGYRNDIKYIDKKLAPVVDNIESQTKANTCFLLTGDHGKSLAFDGEFLGHGINLHESITNVPLNIINAPEFYPTVVNDVISSMDLGNIIMSLANNTKLPVFEKYVAAERLGRGHRKVSNHDYWDRAQRAAWKGDMKIVWDSHNNIRRYRINPNIPNKQIFDTELDRIPRWARNEFDFSIDRLASKHSYFEHYNSLK
jgi:membrane-anchored protein YejM (alkaline phosphatase superfamily)